MRPKPLKSCQSITHCAGGCNTPGLQGNNNRRTVTHNLGIFWNSVKQKCFDSLFGKKRSRITGACKIVCHTSQKNVI